MWGRAGQEGEEDWGKDQKNKGDLVKKHWKEMES